MALLEGRGLVYDYPGPLRALGGVDIAVEEGEFLAVIGPNGSGKSTCLSLLGGLLDPTAGEVRLEGRDLASFADRERALALARVPQFLPALPHTTVDQFVLGGRYARMARWSGLTAEDLSVLENALDRCDVRDLAERSMDELSGGQRQRVLVARALAQEARVLLVDEPTSSLDPEHGVTVFELLEGARGAGCAVILVTHDLNLAAQYASRFVLLDDGLVVARGAAAEVLQKETLEPVYGGDLRYGSWDQLAPQARAVPFVLPHRRVAGPAAGA
jgi:iron complex transport system ATP-binding protein